MRPGGCAGRGGCAPSAGCSAPPVAATGSKTKGEGGVVSVMRARIPRVSSPPRRLRHQARPSAISPIVSMPMMPAGITVSSQIGAMCMPVASGDVSPQSSLFSRAACNQKQPSCVIFCTSSQSGRRSPSWLPAGEARRDTRSPSAPRRNDSFGLFNPRFRRHTQRALPPWRLAPDVQRTGSSKTRNRRRFVAAAALGAPAAALAAPNLANAPAAGAVALRQQLPEIGRHPLGRGGDDREARRRADRRRLPDPLFAAGEVVPGLQVMDAVGAGTVECGYTGAYYYIGKDMSLASAPPCPSA